MNWNKSRHLPEFTSSQKSKKIMEVTKSNFATVLPDVKEAIAASDFLSFDLEFTGSIRLLPSIVNQS
jgi:hypothetical protein